jgi:demethylmenaquinone methyltransferase/2-methoxy-6-polyprenyl-1,4-benzoquinol methylase
MTATRRPVPIGMPTHQAASVANFALQTAGVPGTLEAPQVRALFDRVAGNYDLLNGVMSADLHHQWRRRAADLAEVGAGDRVLDVAAGTGDLTIELAGRVGPGGEAMGCDFSEAMLARARVKAPSLRFELGDALALDYTDGEFDAATVGFAARNFADLDRGLREMARVVRPGGRVVMLDFTTPQRPPLSTFFRIWFDRMVPVLGRLAGQPQAYEYLARSVRRFPGPAELAATMERCGMTNIRYIVTGGGIVTLHVAEVPAPAGTSANAA